MITDLKFTLERVTQPEIEPVTLAEFIEHLREFSTIPQSTKDQLSGLITTGREWAEDFTGRALVDQTWRLTIGGMLAGYSGDIVGGYRGPGPVNPGYYYGAWQWRRAGEILLRKAPVLAITKFVTVDAAGTETDVDAATYQLREADSKWPCIVGLNGATWWPQFGTLLRIEFRAGFCDQTSSPQDGLDVIPQRFKQAIMLYGEALYDRDPDTMDKLLAAAENVIRSERAEFSLA